MWVGGGGGVNQRSIRQWRWWGMLVNSIPLCGVGGGGWGGGCQSTAYAAVGWDSPEDYFSLQVPVVAGVE